MGYTVELPLFHAPSERQELTATNYMRMLDAAHSDGKNYFGTGNSSKLNREAQDDPGIVLPGVHTRGRKERAHTRLAHSVNDNIIHTTYKLNISHVIKQELNIHQIHDGARSA